MRSPHRSPRSLTIAPGSRPSLDALEIELASSDLQQVAPRADPDESVALDDGDVLAVLRRDGEYERLLAFRTVDRAAGAGLVERISDPSDHRFVRLRLTDEGERKLAALRTSHAEELSSLRSDFDSLWDDLPTER